MLIKTRFDEEKDPLVSYCFFVTSRRRLIQVYMAIEALSDGAVKMGIPRPLATQFAAQMVYGSAKMVLDTKRHPGSLRDDGTYIRDI